MDTLQITFHSLGGVAIVLDFLGLWLVGDKKSMSRRGVGMGCMAAVNGLFAVQAALPPFNYTLLWVSFLSCVMQVRAVYNWRQ